MIKYYPEVEQGGEQWIQLRCGVLTASEMKLILTPKLQLADNYKSKYHMWELLAQRITKYVEPFYINDDMLRGHEDEIAAKKKYAEHYAPIKDMGFITNDRLGFLIGFSPDGLVGKDGLIECKSRRQKFQVKTIVEGQMPEDYQMQVQTALLISERKWCDFISYSGGLPMTTIRVYPDRKIQNVIIKAATLLNKEIEKNKKIFNKNIKNKKLRLLPTERKKIEEIIVI